MAANRKDVPNIDSSELKELTEKLITACHILDHEGVTDGYGHVGVRVPGADAFITIANISPGSCHARSLDHAGFRLGTISTAPQRRPTNGRSTPAFSKPGRKSSASRIPTRNGARSSACCRSSSNRCTITANFSPPTARRCIEGVGLVRTLERGNELAAALGDGPAVLMRAHGDAVVGESIEQMIERTTRLAMLGEWNHLGPAARPTEISHC